MVLYDIRELRVTMSLKPRDILVTFRLTHFERLRLIITQNPALRG
jgi:hypothetical protein